MKQVVIWILAILPMIALADTKISALPAASALSGSEIVPVVQSGTTVGATATQFKTFAQSIGGCSSTDVVYAAAVGLTCSSKFTWTDSSTTLLLGSGTLGATIGVPQAAASANGQTLTIRGGAAGTGSTAGGVLILGGGPNGDGSYSQSVFLGNMVLCADTVIANCEGVAPSSVRMINFSPNSGDIFWNSNATDSIFSLTATNTGAGNTSHFAIQDGNDNGVDIGFNQPTSNCRTQAGFHTTGFGSNAPSGECGWLQLQNLDNNVAFVFGFDNGTTGVYTGHFDATGSWQIGAGIASATVKLKTDTPAHATVNGLQIAAVIPATSASIGGSALAAGACSSTATTVTGAAVGMGVDATPNTYPGDSSYWKAYVNAANTVTVLVCEAVAGTPTASTYNLRVLQ